MKKNVIVPSPVKKIAEQKTLLFNVSSYFGVYNRKPGQPHPLSPYHKLKLSKSQIKKERT